MYAEATPMMRWMISTFAVIGASALCMPAAGQDALGAGDVLDANLDPRTGGRNFPVRQPDFRSRNLVVTGDVAGGRGFRDSVGYGAAGDFAGALATDDFFEFRARSAYSSPEAIRTGAYRQQFQFGADLGAMEFRRSPDISAEQLRDMRMPAEEFDAARFVRDRRRDDFVTDRRTGDYSFGRVLDTRAEPRPVGLTYDREGLPYVVTASPIRGIEMIAARDQLASHGLTTYDRMRLRDDELQERLRGPVGTPFDRRFELFAPEGEFRVDAGRVDDRDGVTAETDYARILERIARRYADRPDVDVVIDASMLRELDDRFESLRDELLRMRHRGELPEDAVDDVLDDLDRQMQEERDPTERIEPAQPPTDQRDELLPGLPRPEDQPVERPDDRTGIHLDPEDEDGLVPRRGPSSVQRELIDRLDRIGFEEIAQVLRHGEEVQHFHPRAEQTRFSELVRTGEEAMATGEYFTAERRFQRAVHLTPGHPLASIGLAHAQLGAELDGSAAANLQRILIRHPEMIDTRYDADLLPLTEHLTATKERLIGNVRDGRDVEASGFLLAYLGHQLDDRSAVEEGLRAYSKTRRDDPLAMLLHRIWLDRPAPGEGAARPGQPRSDDDADARRHHRAPSK